MFRTLFLCKQVLPILRRALGKLQGLHVTPNDTISASVLTVYYTTHLYSKFTHLCNLRICTYTGGPDAGVGQGKKLSIYAPTAEIGLKEPHIQVPLPWALPTETVTMQCKTLRVTREV